MNSLEQVLMFRVKYLITQSNSLVLRYAGCVCVVAVFNVFVQWYLLMQKKTLRAIRHGGHNVE